MSYLNKQNVKIRALEVAQHYAPHKVRFSPRFTQDLEQVVDAVIVSMVKGQQEDQRQGLFECEWSQSVIKQAQEVHGIYNDE
mgnify:CR=1 FL=1|jgi:hypothetical protein